MYRNRIILAILGALALLGIVVVPAISAAWPAQTAPMYVEVATPSAGGVLAPPVDLSMNVAPTNPAKIAALVRQAELLSRLGATVAPTDPQEIARLIKHDRLRGAS